MGSINGGYARRLTSHPGLELFPKFSPDGQWIAFTGQYDGDEQVYIIPASGGEPRRLTAYPARGPFAARWGYDNQVTGWHPNGQAVLFRSHRDHFSVNNSRLYKISIDGGLPRALPMTHAGAGAYSPDGRRVLYSPKARDFRTWKRYEGGWAQDLWVFDLGTSSAQRLTDNPRTDRDPIWTDAGIFFVSDRDGYLNLYRSTGPGGPIAQITSHETDVRWASGDRHGNIVYEMAGNLHLHTSDGAGRKLDIQVSDDGWHKRPRTISVGHQVEDYAISPNGKRVLVTARGDIFSVPVAEGVIRNLTDSPAHERLAKWSPDGILVAYVSDASGEEEIWLRDARGTEPARQLTKDNQLRIYRIEWSPDGQQLAIGDKDGRLYVADRDKGRLTEIGGMGAWYNQDFAWSPNSRYLAYSSLSDNFMRSIVIWDNHDHATHTVTSRLTNDFNPAWHPSADVLYFLSDREFAPQIGSFEWNYVVDRETVILGLALTSTAKNPFRENNAEADSNGDRTSPTSTTLIRFDGLEDRLFRVPIDADNYASLAVTEDGLLIVRDGPFYYGRQSDIQSELLAYSIQDREPHSIVTGIQTNALSTDVGAADAFFSLATESPRVVVNQDGQISVFELDGEQHVLPTQKLRKRIDPRKEWRVIFWEVWRRFRDFFYVENMHGHDWQAIGDRYSGLLNGVSHRADLNYLIGEMIAELNAGHAYVHGGDQVDWSRPNPALLGAQFDVDLDTQLYRIRELYPGDNSIDLYRSPMTEVGVSAAVGDYVIAINGKMLNTSTNVYELLRESDGELLEVSLNTQPSAAGARQVLVKPVASELPLQYSRWTNRNRAYVDRMSNGRLGYLHLPDMGSNGIREFIRGYYGQIRKDGLVVDVRGNLGGNISQMVLERLLRRPYSLGYVQGEQHARVYPWGVGGTRVFTGKIIVLANDNTMSDGDAFTWTFMQAGDNRVVGTRTWGGVVGTDDTGTLVDGGGLRVPQFALADLDGNWIVEGHGVEPTVHVENDPVSLSQGRDLQLERAVDELLDLLGDQTPGKLPAPAPGPTKTPAQ